MARLWLACSLAAVAAQHLDADSVAAKCVTGWCANRRCVILNGAGKVQCKGWTQDKCEADRRPSAWCDDVPADEEQPTDVEPPTFQPTVPVESGWNAVDARNVMCPALPTCKCVAQHKNGGVYECMDQRWSKKRGCDGRRAWNAVTCDDYPSEFVAGLLQDLWWWQYKKSCAPTMEPTGGFEETREPTEKPSDWVQIEPTSRPSERPTSAKPTFPDEPIEPTLRPSSAKPTDDWQYESPKPTTPPTEEGFEETREPSEKPSEWVQLEPTFRPSTAKPTPTDPDLSKPPTAPPTGRPTDRPTTAKPTEDWQFESPKPTTPPTDEGGFETREPTEKPFQWDIEPTFRPSTAKPTPTDPDLSKPPTAPPTDRPTDRPTTAKPTEDWQFESPKPTTEPTEEGFEETREPSEKPSEWVQLEPTFRPSTAKPTQGEPQETKPPTSRPTDEWINPEPSERPTSAKPTHPQSDETRKPTHEPTSCDDCVETKEPTLRPTKKPSIMWPPTDDWFMPEDSTELAAGCSQECLPGDTCDDVGCATCEGCDGHVTVLK